MRRGSFHFLFLLHTLASQLLAGTVCECSGLPPMYMPADAGVDTLAMFAEGFTFPIEGPQKLAEVMVERLATRGGEIRTNSKVVKARRTAREKSSRYELTLGALHRYCWTPSRAECAA